VGYDFSLKRAVVEVDRDADRRWSFATDKMKLAEDKGETFSDSAPLEDFQKKQKAFVGKSPERVECFRVCFTLIYNHFTGEVPNSKFHVIPLSSFRKEKKKVSKISFIS